MIEINDSSLIIETEKFIKYLKIEEILFFKADGCYCEINMITKEKILIPKTLKEIQSYFSERNFCRCHKSFLINMQHFKELKKNSKVKIVILFNDTSVPVSQRKLQSFKDCLKSINCR
jgi:two-component system LytT family response regulator